ncbi:MAG: trypsin-like peptidase domain-containing protein, partial [Candidatus Staskawiczbacteria bacterium]
MTKNNKSMYDIQPIDFTKIHEAIAKARQKANFWFIGAAIIIFAVFGFSLGLFLNGYFYSAVEGYLKDIGSVPISTEQSQYVPQTSQEQAVIDAVRQYSPAVVSIVVSKDVPVMEEYFYNPFEGFDIGPEIQIPQYRQNGTERQEIGGGSGFIVSADGLVLTNKHVVLDDEAEYTVFTNDGQKFSAKVLAKDPVQDLAVMKIEPIDAKPFPVVKFGDSDNLQ